MWGNPRQRSRPRKQLTSAGSIDTALAIGRRESDAESAARLIGDRVERQQRLARPPVAALREVRKRDPGRLLYELPLPRQ
jgi:hypothetical protein